MIHYHAVGWDAIGDVARWIAGRHALVAYPVARFVEKVAPIVQSFVLDNGAYTYWQSGEQYDFEGYVQHVEHWHRHPAFDWAVIPDVIDGTEAENDAYLASWPEHLRGVPVWHMHEPVERLCRLGECYDRVALGSSGDVSHPGSTAWWRRMSEAMDALCDDQGRPPCRLHGLRMLRPSIVSRLPLASADSGTASRATRDVFTRGKPGYAVSGITDKRVRAEIMALRLESTQSAERWERVDQYSLFNTNHDPLWK